MSKAIDNEKGRKVLSLFGDKSGKGEGYFRRVDKVPDKNKK